MQLASFSGGFGRVEGDEIVPMGADLADFLTTGEMRERPGLPIEEVELLGPVPHPDKIVGIGLNYRDHAAESGQEVPPEPILFPKFANSVIGPGAAIRIPRPTGQVDYEAELGAVIGREAREVSEREALDYVAGYLCANDVSARDLQFNNGGQWLLGKAIDTFLPTGPFLVTSDEVVDPQQLPIRCIVNGEALQDSNTSQMVFSVGELVSFISRTLTLAPGDIIVTGTPAGVGFARKPPRFLSSGDEVTVQIEGIGSLTNPVVERSS
jgi:2,4-didehydro-3-deoxy-L-rhamnonate hydrolase